MSEEYESVDLTEDERSSEENFSDERGPVNFVDCGTVVTTISSTFTCSTPPPLTRISRIKSIESPKQTVKNQAILPQRTPRKIKPRSSVLAETQDIIDVDSPNTTKTACVASPEGKLSDVAISQNVPGRNQFTPDNSQNQTIYSQRQPGKVVIIKKNNKYYKIVIPHNVMPNINQSTGPVLINIPEVGPLVISNDPQVTKSNSAPVNQPFSLNLDDVQQSIPKSSKQPVKKPKKIPEVSRKEAALSNKRFCWTYSKGRKRDLEGFCYNDRLGFTRADCQRAKKCSTILNSIVDKKRTDLINHMAKFNMFKYEVKRNRAKLLRTYKAGKTFKKKIVKDQMLPPLPKIPKDMALGSMSYEPQNINFPTGRTEQNTDYDSDLLLTKKVVILNGKNAKPGIKKRKIKAKKLTRQKTKSSMKMKLKAVWARKLAKHKKIVEKNKAFMLKPCYVHMVRDEIVEEAYRKYVGAMGFTDHQTSKVNSGYTTKVASTGRPKMSSNPVNLKAIVTPQTTALQKSTNVCYKASILDTTNIFKARMIRTEEDFRKEMNFAKPFLIINEHNLGIVNYSTQFAKSNIIYIVRENRYFPLSILRNDSFISALELGFLKLVDSQLFCKYIAGSIVFNNDRHVSDHNYCLSRNKRT